MSAVTSRWIRSLAPSADPALRLLCLPHAGGGASAYRSWREAASDGVAVLAVQPPGRGDRIGEPCCATIGELVEAVGRELGSHYDQPLVLFGQSVGAVVAFELAVHLERDRGTCVDLLAVAGAVPPMFTHPMAALASLAEAQLTAVLRSRGALPDELVQTPGLLDVVLPAVRADLAMLGAYRYAGGQVSSPILAVAGEHDAEAPPDVMGGWSLMTTGPVAKLVLPGGHLLAARHAPEIVAEIQRIAAPVGSASSRWRIGAPGSEPSVVQHRPMPDPLARPRNALAFARLPQIDMSHQRAARLRDAS